MITPITLLGFPTSGRLGDLCTGLTEDGVRAMLGEPYDVGGTSRKYKKPNIRLYGTVEVDFSREHSPACTGMFWDAVDQGRFRLIGKASKEDWPWLPLMPCAEVERWLHEHGISFVRTAPMAGMMQCALPSGVRITFHEDQLTSVSF